MNIQWNKVTWYSKVAAVVLGVAIFALGIYIGILYQRGKDAMAIAGQITITRPPVVEKRVVSVYEFTQVGNIKNDATGEIEADEWVLVYEHPGSPALTKNVIFTTGSRCVANGMAELCNTAILEQGERVKVMGYEDEVGAVIVERLDRMK